MIRTPKNASSASSGTTTYGERSRSSSRLATTYPMAPPARCRSLVSPMSGCGLPSAIWTMPRMPKAREVQPTTWRPAGPACSGSRIVRQPTKSSASGTRKPTLPTEPWTTVRARSMTEPGSCHHTAAATTTAEPKRKRPNPSRRCSGSRSRAVCPMPRATAPTPCATASHTAAMPRKIIVKRRATGPGPLRTARGAGRLGAGLRLLAGFFLGAGLRRGLVLRVAVLVPVFFAGPREVLAVRVEDVLLLRDPGGEDVRVAIVPTLRRGHSSHTDHRSACRRRGSGSDVGGRASRAAEERSRDRRVETRWAERRA